MATANPDNAEITCKNPDCTIGILKWSDQYDHLVKAKTCEVFYTKEEIESMKPQTSFEKRKQTRKAPIEKYVQSSNSKNLVSIVFEISMY